MQPLAPEVTRRFCTFSLGDLLLGVAVETVQEVLRPQLLSRVPLAPRAVSGLINLRGQIVLALDLATALGVPRKTTPEAAENVVIRGAEGAVSLLVDAVGDVIDVPAERMERTPDTLRGALGQAAALVVKLDRRLLVVLDPERTVDAAFGAMRTGPRETARAAGGAS